MGPCPFCSRISSGTDLIGSNEAAVAFHDHFPVSAGHALVVPRRHVERLEDLAANDWHAVFSLVREVALTARHIHGTDGVNVGVNSGPAAGQTVDHAHVHVIPRRAGDVDDPRGGIRWVLPERADYWSRRG